MIRIGARWASTCAFVGEFITLRLDNQRASAPQLQPLLDPLEFVPHSGAPPMPLPRRGFIFELSFLLKDR